MPEIAWYRSLYWRIALGFVALLAVLLAVQGVVFLWLTGRAAELLPGRSPAEYAQTIALDTALVLKEQPQTNLDEYLNGRYRTAYRPFVVVTRDGRLVSSRRIAPPFDLSRATLIRLLGGDGGPGRFGGGRGGDGRPASAAGGRSGEPAVGRGGEAPPDRGGDPVAGRGADPAAARGSSQPPGTSSPTRPEGGRGRGDRGRDGFGRGRGGPGPLAAVFAPVVVDGVTVAMVGVTTDPRPLWAAIRDLGPALGFVGIGLLIAGTAVGALLIFRPTHRRLRSLQEAARALGAGQTGVRAVANGGDEVSMLARAFNEMAGDLEQRTKALVAVDESRRQLLADVSHELMTPLAAIRGYAETMSMADVKLDEATRQRYLRIVGEETERMEHIIGDLLDLARAEGGGGVWKREPVSIAALFERVLHRHGPVLQDKSIALDRRIAADVGTVSGDPNRLEQAIQNLAANAVRHTPEGGRVVLSAERAAGGVRLAVEDSGSGIPPEHLARVFDRFYKADVSRTGTAVPSGSGLGLSIVQAIVRRHGGRIEAANVDGGGARFEIFLPDVPTDEARPTP